MHALPSPLTHTHTYISTHGERRGKGKGREDNTHPNTHIHRSSSREVCVAVHSFLRNNTGPLREYYSREEGRAWFSSHYAILFAPTCATNQSDIVMMQCVIRQRLEESQTSNSPPPPTSLASPQIKEPNPRITTPSFPPPAEKNPS